MMEELLTSRPGEHGGSQPTAIEDPRDRGVNFAMFLTMMSEHLFEFDAEAELLEAFSSFDESDSGMVGCDEIRKWLGETGDRMNQGEVCVPFVVVLNVSRPRVDPYLFFFSLHRSIDF